MIDRVDDAVRQCLAERSLLDSVSSDGGRPTFRTGFRRLFDRTATLSAFVNYCQEGANLRDWTSQLSTVSLLWDLMDTTGHNTCTVAPQPTPFAK